MSREWKDVTYHMSLGNCELKNNKMLEWSQSQALTTSKPAEDKEQQKLSFIAAAAAAAKLLQLCLTLCDPIDGSPPGPSIPGIFQTRTLEWVAISFSNAWKWKVKVKSLSRVQLLLSPWTAAHQAPLSMGFSRQEYWSGVPLPSPSFIASGMQNTGLVKSFRFSVTSY